MSDRTVKKSWSRLREHLWLVLFALAAILVAASVLSGRAIDYADVAARRMERRLDSRTAVLGRYMDEALATGRTEWPALDGLPSDMVVYRYVDDTLQSWKHQFTTDNDNIGSRRYLPQFVNLRYSVMSPLSEVDTSFSYMNLGPKWYLVRKITDGSGCEVIGGLEIKNTLDGTYNGVNPAFRLSDRFAVYPISASGGAVVAVRGKALLKVLQENSKVIPLMPDATMLWLAILIIIGGILAYLLTRRTIPAALTTMAVTTVIMAAFYVIGMGLQASSKLFSPTVYAAGPVLYSLGAVLILNLWIVLMVLSLYIVRFPLYGWLRRRRPKVRMMVFGIAVTAAAIAIAAYSHACFKSLIFNSNITLQLYRVGQLTPYTGFVYLSFLTLLAMIPVLIQLLRGVTRYLYGFHFNAFSRAGRIAFSVLCSIYLVAMSSILGFRREADRVEIWANRLAIDRNLGFELQLRGIEQAIVLDQVIPRFIGEDGGGRIILNRLKENYFTRISQDFDINVAFFADDYASAETLRRMSDPMGNAVPVADSSRFKYARNAIGRTSYTGKFPYYSPEKGKITMAIFLDSKADKEDRGYAAIFGSSGSGSMVLPQRYSYGRYLDGKLISYQGEYAYPTVLSGKLLAAGQSGDHTHETIDGYVHFINRVNPGESVVISRPNEDLTQYLVAWLVVMLAAYACITVFSRRRRPGAFRRNYYKQRINVLMLTSLTGTLIAMAAISVLFVYRRNETNVMNLMTGKINTIQSLINAQARYFDSYEDFSTQGTAATLEEIGNFTKSDISLYTTSGRVFASTRPEVFDRLLLGSRVNEDAFRSIMYEHLRYYIHKENAGGYSYYSMYAPVFNEDGKMLAIVSSPYTESALGFRSEAVFHAIFIIAVFFLLLLLTRLLTTEVVDKMFGPLIEMGRKMNLARTEGLEYIIYDREDEISSLVRAYNLMVHDLSESSKQVALVERNKAWSEMARQVAHEIKNPLTPIKLQIQRIIRLKQRNDPGWEDKFDSIVPVIMDSIDGLTDTANEFSTFAKLYSEEPVEIDLDGMARDQIALFDDKDNISFQYFGLQGARTVGPKPQLTRVFVNLLTNAIQAVESMQKDMEEKGQEPVQGQILLSLRNSSKEGYYDIVFEDNGPGVKDEDRGRLFTPNFTTKSSGTGLGLAICKSILELCGGEIFYSKSFSLKGACFTVRIPKHP